MMVRDERRSAEGDSTVERNGVLHRAAEAKSLLDEREPARWLRSYVGVAMPWLMAAIAVTSGILAIQRIGVLVNWERTFTGAGQIVVTGCETHSQWGPDQWHCQGRLTIEGQVDPEPSTMVVSRGAMRSFHPYIGQQWDVFFGQPVDETQEVPRFVYADQLQLSEIARLYISVLPRVLLSAGAAAWVLGWFLNARSGSKGTNGLLKRLPGLGSLQRRAVGWMVTAFVAYLVYRLIAHHLLGSVSVA